MTLEGRIAELERRVASLERLTMPMVPLGPTPSYEALQNQHVVDRINDSLLRRVEDANNG